MRVLSATVPIKNNPMASNAKVKKIQQQLENADGAVLRVITRSAGNMYSDSAQAEECWFVTPKPTGGVEVTHVHRIHFHSKPAFVAGKIEKAMTDAQIDQFTKWIDWSKSVRKNV